MSVAVLDHATAQPGPDDRRHRRGRHRALAEMDVVGVDGGGIAVFEHDGEQDEWFGARPATEVLCQGMPTRVVEIDDYLAASCPCGPRYLTIVGAQDVEEVERLLAFWIPENAP